MTGITDTFSFVDCCVWCCKISLSIRVYTNGSFSVLVHKDVLKSIIALSAICIGASKSCCHYHHCTLCPHGDYGTDEDILEQYTCIWIHVEYYVNISSLKIYKFCYWLKLSYLIKFSLAHVKYVVQLIILECCIKYDSITAMYCEIKGNRRRQLRFRDISFRDESRWIHFAKTWAQFQYVIYLIVGSREVSKPRDW